MNTCSCSGWHLMFCVHPRTCVLCKALTTGLRPPDLNLCGGCHAKMQRDIFSDEEPLLPSLVRELMDWRDRELEAVP